MMDDENPVRFIVEGPIARVILNRPASRNALNLPMCLALREAFEQIDADRSIRVVLISAEGVAFCAGADLSERKGRDQAWVRARRLSAFAAYDAIERCSRPVVAMVQGAVVGSGGEIAMACDFIIAASDTSFRFPEPLWGTVGATQRLQRVIGKRRAKEMLFTGRKMPVEEAYTLGLVARVVPSDQLLHVCNEIVGSIAAAPSLAIELTKQAIDLGEEVELAKGIRIELAAIERCLADDGWRRGIEQFSQNVDPKASSTMPEIK